MGGFGSTRWGWVITKDTVEESRSLDINRLNRAGCLRAGYCGGLQWSCDGEQVASIQFRRDANALAVIVIGLPTPRSVKIAMTGPCAVRITFACGLAESPAWHPHSLLGQRVCTAGLT